MGNNHREGLRVKIKGRVIGDTVNSGHRIGQLNLNGDWDIIILSLMDNEFQPLEMYQLNHEEVVGAVASSSEKRSRRGAISVAKFRIIGDLVWTKEHGVEDFSHYNDAYNVNF